MSVIGSWVIAVIEPETRSPDAVVVSAANRSISIGPALVAAKQSVPEGDPGVAAPVVVVTATGANDTGKPLLNTADDPTDPSCAPARDQRCDLSGTRGARPVSGTPIADPVVTESITPVGSRPKYGALGGAGAEIGSDALLGGAAGAGGVGDSAGDGESAWTSTAAGSGNIGGGGTSVGSGVAGGTAGADGTGE